jgi:DNA-binding response OmpR family regulator
MAEKTKILLVDDDIRLGEILTSELNEYDKYEVEYLNTAYGVTEAIQTTRPDVLVFDVKIGNLNGIEIIQQLYGGNPDYPTIFISSNNAEDVKEEGLLSAGAVAYLDKPFSTRTLAAYIDRFVREQKKDPASGSGDNHIRQFGDTQFDTYNRVLICKNRKIIPLRPMVYLIFKKLTNYFGLTVSREDLMHAAWEGLSEYYNEQSLNNNIRHLRKMLKNDTNLEIELNRGLGYRLVVER